MKFCEALKPLIVLQRTFGFSLVAFTKDDVQISKLAILFAKFSLIAKTLAFSTFSYYFSKIKFHNPIDPNSSYSSFLLGLPLLLSLVAIFGIWFIAISHRQYDLQFMKMFLVIDKRLENLFNFKETYLKVRSKCFYWSIGAITFPCMFLLSFGTVSENTYAMHVIKTISLVGVMFFYGHTINFAMLVNMVRDRFDIIISCSHKITKMTELMVLVEAEKTLVQMMHLMNRSICIKHGFILIADWVGVTIQFYMSLLTIVFWRDTSIRIICVMIPTVAAHGLIIFVSFYCGDQLEESVSINLKNLVESTSRYHRYLSELEKGILENSSEFGFPTVSKRLILEKLSEFAFSTLSRNN